MLITDIDRDPRQGNLWCEQQRHIGGSISLPINLVFFALYPDPHTARCLGCLAWHLRDKHKLDGRPIADRLFHVSLCSIGDYSRLPHDALAALNHVMAMIPMPPFMVAFDQMTSFNGGSKRPLVLTGGEGIAGLMLFQRAIVAALREAGFGRGKCPPYNPHVTLLYDKHRIADQPVEAVSWTVQEVALVCSLRGQSRHIPLARWPLRG